MKEGACKSPVWQPGWGGSSHIDRSHRKKLFHTAVPSLLTVICSLPIHLFLPAALSQGLWAWKRLGFCWSIGSGWILGALGGRPLTASTLFAGLPPGLFFQTGQKGEEEGQREGGSWRWPGAAWLQLSLAISEWASRWQVWSALLALLGSGELCYLEQGNNPLFNFNILTVHSTYVTYLQGVSICSHGALPPPNVMIRTHHSSAVWW